MTLSNKSVKQILVGLIFQTYFIIMAGQEMYFTEEGWPWQPLEHASY